MRWEYYPYGQALTVAGTGETPFQFTGKALDSETGLYYYGARYYDPVIGRWIVVDPWAKKYPAWSPYNYGFDQPVKYVDPNGKGPDLFTRFARALGMALNYDNTRAGRYYRVNKSGGSVPNALKNDLKNDLTAAKKSFDNTRAKAAKLSTNLGRVASWGAGGLGTLALLTAPAPPVSTALASGSVTLGTISTGSDFLSAALTIGLENQNKNAGNAAKSLLLDAVGNKTVNVVKVANKGIQEIAIPIINATVEATKSLTSEAITQANDDDNDEKSKENGND